MLFEEMSTRAFSAAPHFGKAYYAIEEAEELTFMMFRRIATENTGQKSRRKNYLRLISAWVANASPIDDIQSKRSIRAW